MLAAHSASRTSVALAKVLLQEQYGHEVELQEMEPDLGQMLQRADAALLIGDPCLAAAASTEVAHKADLGAVWDNHQGLPFVYAVWVTAAEQPAKELVLTLMEAKEHGVPAIPEIAKREAGRAGLSQPQIQRYLQVDLNYELKPAHLDGIRAFADLCVRHGLLQKPREIRFT